MTWPIPAPGVIAERYAAGFDAAFATDPDGVPYPDPPDTRSPDTVFRALGTAGEATWTEAYLYQAALAAELMPDTAQDWLPRHGAEWGVPTLQPLPSLGSLVFPGAPGTVLPSGIEATRDTGLLYATVAPATIGATGAVSIPATALVAGTAGDCAAGTVLQLVSPVAGLSSQGVTVGAQPDGAGFVGGRDAEDPEAWRARILQRIRNRGAAGDAADYRQWAIDAGAAYVRVLPLWQGAGTVGVCVAMPGPRVPTPAELARIAAAIEEVRPVTAAVLVLPAVLLSVPVQLAISPDTALTRAGVVAALAALFAREGGIGTPLPLSRIDAAVSSAAGEYAQDILQPPGDVLPGPTQLPVSGGVSFVAGAVPPPPP